MKYKGVILAAGKGSRMESFSASYPKAILPICNKLLMEYHIEQMSKIGICEILVVIGHLGFKIVNAIGNGEKFGVKIRYIDQGETLGIAHALGKLEKFVDSPFLLFLGDIFFITNDDLSSMIKLMENSNAKAVLATKIEHDKEALKKNFSVILKDGTINEVKRVIEKPRYAINNIKGCGFYLFDLNIFDAIRRTPRTAMRDEYEITDSIQILIEDGFVVKQQYIVEEDMNLTIPDDLLTCNLKMLRFKSLEKLIGNNTSIHKDSTIINSVIGDNVKVCNPIKIVNSVIFENVEFQATNDLMNCIVTPEKIYHVYNRDKECNI